VGLATYLDIIVSNCSAVWAGIAQSLQRLSYGLDGAGIETQWEARFSETVQIGPGAHSTSYATGTEFFLEVKRPGGGINHSPTHLAPRLKKEYSYTSTSPLGLRGPF